MIDDIFVIDSVVHAFNLDSSNWVEEDGAGEMYTEFTGGFMHGWNPPELYVPDHVWRADWTADDLVDTMFRESKTDIAVNHHLPLYGWFKDGMCSREKNVELAERYPDRFLFYAAVDPTQGLDACIAALKEQVAEMPVPVTGLKLYPVQINPLKSYRLDDQDLMWPLFELCLELGIKTVAQHKAVPTGAVPFAPFGPADVEEAARSFPTITFEVIHAGLAFMEETAKLLALYPNVYANLETTTMLLHKSPGQFEEMLAYLAFWGGYEKIVFSSGAMYTHPQAVLDRFMELEYNDATLNKFGVGQITHEQKKGILGANYARMIGLSIDDAAARIKDDEFAAHQREGELDKPFSNWVRRGTERHEAAVAQ